MTSCSNFGVQEEEFRSPFHLFGNSWKKLKIGLPIESADITLVLALGAATPSHIHTHT